MFLPNFPDFRFFLKTLKELKGLLLINTSKHPLNIYKLLNIIQEILIGTKFSISQSYQNLSKNFKSGEKRNIFSKIVTTLNKNL